MRLRKLFITLCMAIFTAVLCVFGLIACKQETFALKIVFKEAPYAYTRGETVDAYDFIEKQEGVSYAFAFDYLTISETGETVVSKKESVSGNTYSNLPITEIALQSGFSSISTFNRVFKKFKECTPTEFKEFYKDSGKSIRKQADTKHKKND